MTKTTTYKLTLVLFSTLALGGCGSDPIAGQTTPGTGGAIPGTGGAMVGTGGAVTGTGGAIVGTGGAVTGTGGAVTATGGSIAVGPDAGAPDVAAPDAPVGDPTITYSVSVSPTRLLDLVFMIDNSPSMAPKVAKMNAQFPKLIAALKDPNDGTLPDLRVAMIDSDLGTGGAYQSSSCGPKMLPDGLNSPYGDLGRFQMINATSCGVTNANSTFLEYTKGSPVNFQGDINQVFACLASNLGTLGCGEEHSLQAFEFALVASGLGPVNDAQHMMLRGNANLGLVFLTDEDDCSAAPNDGIFGDKAELRGESASLRCYTRSHTCNGKNLSDSTPGYPTTQAFTSPLSGCSARTDSCSSINPLPDDSQPTPQCSPLKDIHALASEIKALKTDPDNQIFVAGIFGWPLSDADMATATYKIDAIPNPNAADTAHPTVFDSWPVCYDPTHKPADPKTFDVAAAGFGATAGLRNAAFVDEFGANGMKVSICQTDFSSSMKVIGDKLAKNLQNLCINDKLRLNSSSLPDCRVVYRTPTINPNNPSHVIYQDSPNSLPMCPAGAINGNVATDCWMLSSDSTKCPNAFNGQWVNVLRTADEIMAGPLTPGTQIGMQCKICSTSPSAVPLEGC